MPKVVRHPEARIDLVEIALHIGRKSQDAALRLLDRLEAKFELLSSHPEMGELREDLAPKLRTFHVGSYAIFFRATENGIEVVRVLHASRDIESLF
jgi:toxin ParE1/3/4